MAHVPAESALGGFILSAKDLGLVNETKSLTKSAPSALAVTQQAIHAVSEISGLSEDDIKRDLAFALKGYNISSSVSGESAMRMFFGNTMRFHAEELADIDTHAMAYLGATFIQGVLIRKSEQLAAGLADLQADPPMRRFTSDNLRKDAITRETQQHELLARHVDVLTASIDLFATEHWEDQAAEYRRLLDQLCPSSEQQVKLHEKMTSERREDILSQLRALRVEPTDRQRRAAATVQ